MRQYFPRLWYDPYQSHAPGLGLTHIHAHTTHTHTRTHNTHTCLGLHVCMLVVCALQEVQHVGTFTPLALGPGLTSS